MQFTINTPGLNQAIACGSSILAAALKTLAKSIDDHGNRVAWQMKQANTLQRVQQEAATVLISEGDDSMGFVIADNGSKKLKVSFKSAAGNPATVDGAPVWASSDEGIATVVADPDGMSATVSAVGPAGNVQITVTADADLGAGVRNLVGTADITVVGGEAAVVSIEPADEVPA